ncbi:MAG: hypothetical protein A3I73_02425 [Omnitrophica bacterium RIFCSPLOWO2_02_FULL_45_16]|nr:MAG: hypothetical protein A3I73_02425 [Omnitrophica bacterium RIFCSPLOWO2_02_FULL_45_16]
MVSFFWLWTPVVIWMAFIFLFSSIKSEDIPEFNVPNIDKLFHSMEYFILGALLFKALSNSIANPNLIYILSASILIASLYGATDEFHQRFISGRSCDFFDLLTDVIGSAIGAGLWLYRERSSRAVNKTF